MINSPVAYVIYDIYTKHPWVILDRVFGLDLEPKATSSLLIMFSVIEIWLQWVWCHNSVNCDRYAAVGVQAQRMCELPLCNL